MDNVTHTLTGVVLAQSGLDRLSRRARAALILSSNLPDTDGVIALWGNLWYLEHHRGITHSLAGMAILSVVLGGALSLGGGRGAKVLAPPVKPLALMGLSLAGMAIHLFMDYTNSYGVRPFLPWSGRWYYGDYVFIVDPWMWLVLGAAAYGGSRPRWQPVWWALTLGITLLLWRAAHAGLTPPASTLLPLWGGGVLGARLLGRRFTGNSVALARLALLLLVIYVSFLARNHRLALGESRVAARARDSSAVIAALPTPADPFRWVLVVETRRELFVKARDGDWLRLPRRLDDPAVEAARSHCAVEALFRFYRFPWAEVANGRTGTSLTFHDVRFQTARGSAFADHVFELGPGRSTAHFSERCPIPAAWITREARPLSPHE